MILVRSSFIAKPGQAGKLAGLLKEMAAAGELQNARVMTDLVANFNQVVMEHEVESAADFEANLQRYAQSPELREKTKGYLELWETGKRELFRIL